MKRMPMRRLSIVVVATMAWLATAAMPAAADIKTAVEAFRSGDYTTAFKEFSTLAAAGDRYAQYNLGVMYLTGQGVAKDAATSYRWQRKAADQGLAVAQHGLGVLYYRGEGVGQDDKAAARWFRKAAEQGLANAQFNLGVMYFNGRGVKPDKFEVVKWISLAAGQGMKDAEYRLGMMYDRGSVFAQNRDEALYWYRKAAAGGHARAKERIAALAGTGTAPAAAANRTTDEKTAGDTMKATLSLPAAAAPVVAARPATPPPAATPRAAWRVQLASFRSMAEAAADWRRLTRAHPDLRGQTPQYLRVDLGPPKGAYVRLLSAALSGREAAYALCARLKKRAPRQGCIPIRPQPPAKR
jgi:TPR repeat protein